MNLFENARELLSGFTGSRYGFGFGVLEEAGFRAEAFGRGALLIRSGFPGIEPFAERLRASLGSRGVALAGEVRGAAPNAPIADLARLVEAIQQARPGFLISFGAGSTIDCVKAANVIATLGGTVEEYFGTDMVTAALRRKDSRLLPHLSIQTAASSSAHLTKYSNITDPARGQKKLIVDTAIVPEQAVFDYATTVNAPAALTIDGALDGLSHCLEVWYGSAGKPWETLSRNIALTAIELILRYLPAAVSEPAAEEPRLALGLATDLGGFAIMTGGTNGAHLTSFSLVDVLAHGRACGMLNPYYTVFYSPAIQPQLADLSDVLRRTGWAAPGLESRSGRALAEGVASALMRFEASLGIPVRLNDVPGFGAPHIERALTAAKSPQLRMKLENMPVPLSSEDVDAYMRPILESAATGDVGTIRSMGEAAVS